MNAYIPALGNEGHEDKCPPVHYSSIFQCHLNQIWNLCIKHHHEDILHYTNNIEAPLHQVLYHPDAMKTFTFIVQEFLILPVGSIFGAKNSPSFFTLQSKTQAHTTSNFEFQDNDKLENMMPLAQWFHLIPPPTPWESAAMVKSVVDSQHQWVQDERYHNLTFVYDNGVVNIRNRIWQAIDNSIQAAYNHRTPCLNEEKWLELCSYVMLYWVFTLIQETCSSRGPWRNDFSLLNLLTSFYHKTLASSCLANAAPCQVSSGMQLW